MAKIETYACDQCGTKKKEVNKWWKAYLTETDAGDKTCGVLILEWDINSISKPFTKADLLPTKADAHLCGSNCVAQYISQKATSSTMNHVFTCATCRKQWTIVSDQTFECFFVGLCYWCITKIGLTFDEISSKLEELATDERFAEELASRL